MHSKLLIPMTNWSIKFVKSDPKFCLKSSVAGKDFRFVIDRPRLLIPKVHVAAQIQLGIEKTLSQRPACYSFKNISTKDWIINQGATEFRQENLFHSDFVPDETLILLVTLASQNGGYDSSCLTAKHHNVSDLFLAVDNERWPRVKADVDWSSSSDFLRPYSELWSGQIDNWMDLGSMVTPERFRDGGFLYWRVNMSITPEITELFEDPRRTSLVRLEVS